MPSETMPIGAAASPADEIEHAVRGKGRDLIFASDAIVRTIAMRAHPGRLGPRDPAVPTTQPSQDPVSQQTRSSVPETVATGAAAAHFEAMAMTARHAADDPATPVDEQVAGEQHADAFRQMAAAHRKAFPVTITQATARRPTGQGAVHTAPAMSRRVVTRR